MIPIVCRNGFRKEGIGRHPLFLHTSGLEGLGGFGFSNIDQTAYRNATRSNNMEGWGLGSRSFELDLPSQMQEALSVFDRLQLAPLHFVVAVAQNRRLGCNCFPQTQTLQQKPLSQITIKVLFRGYFYWFLPMKEYYQ